MDPEHSWWGWANGFSAYINWFQIDQHNQFGTLNPQEVVDLGAAAPPGNFVTRSATTGQILEVTSGVTNLGNGRNEGVEYGFTYTSKEYNWGKIELQFDGSYALLLGYPANIGGRNFKWDPLLPCFQPNGHCQCYLAGCEVPGKCLLFQDRLRHRHG